MRYWPKLLAAALIPLGSANEWQDLKFSKIPPNRTEFSTEGLTVTVNHSASPLIYPLPKAGKISGFSVKLEIEGKMSTTPTEFAEDAYFRMGLVVPGERQLGWKERLFAAAWVKKLFALVPKGSGIDKIYFFNLDSQEQRIGRHRTLPGSKDLIVETVIASRGPDQKLVQFTHRLDKPMTVAALWISTDGDDTKSTFVVRIKEITLDSAP